MARSVPTLLEAGTLSAMPSSDKETALLSAAGADEPFPPPEVSRESNTMSEEAEQDVMGALEREIEEAQDGLANENTGLLCNEDNARELSMLGQGKDDFDDASATGDLDPETKSMRDKMKELLVHTKAHEEIIMDRMHVAEALVNRVKAEVAEARAARIQAVSRMNAMHHEQHCMPPKPGPLEWVDGNLFGGLCSTIVALNLGFMVKHSKMSHEGAAALDNLFLFWYCCELCLKFSHHRRSLFFGPLSAVRWNWLDAGIVISGIVEQWLSPIVFGAAGPPGGGTALSSLRLLRLFRFLRILKIVKSFLITDTDWLQESQKFELFMALIITLNAITMSFELDIEWGGWIWVDNAFLTIYVFELLLRLKRYGWQFFISPDDYTWNLLDFFIVTTGMLDLWLMPGIQLFKTQVLEQQEIDQDSEQAHQFHSIMSLVRLTRLMRVLRLVRVLRSVPPLYTLLIGVGEAFGAMKWVMVLTFLTLYGGAIVFTNLIGKGLIYENHEAPAEAIEVFGTMFRSLFSLFELMNGETSVIKPIVTETLGKFLFACFMVVSNWAVLAILTAVVSENMIASANRFAKEEVDKQGSISTKKSRDRLLELFLINDPDKNGFISRAEWAAMIADDCIRLELAEGTHLSKGDLLDLFECLTVEKVDVYDGDTVDYRRLIQSLQENSDLADKRSVLHVMIRMRAMQTSMTATLDSKCDELATMVRRIETHVRGEGASL